MRVYRVYQNEAYSSRLYIRKREEGRNLLQSETIYIKKRARSQHSQYKAQREANVLI
jgi:hypothetical protein